MTEVDMAPAPDSLLTWLEIITKRQENDKQRRATIMRASNEAQSETNQ